MCFGHKVSSYIYQTTVLKLLCKIVYIIDMCKMVYIMRMCKMVGFLRIRLKMVDILHEHMMSTILRHELCDIFYIIFITQN